MLDKAALKSFAAKYIWWEAPEVAVTYPERVVAQVMNLGDYDDVLKLVNQIGEGELRKNLLVAEPGWFNERSWAYWHLRLGVVSPGEGRIPDMPRRVFA